MRRIIESLTPDSRRFYWRWIGSMFALYVALLIGAAGAFTSHESSRKVAHEDAATVAIERGLAPTYQVSVRQTPRLIDRIQPPIALRATTSR